MRRPRFGPPHAEPCGVHRRQRQQREHRRDDEPAHDGDGHRPPEDTARQGDHRQHGGSGGEHDRAQPAHGGFHDGIPCRHAPRAVALDLVDQDDGVALDHAHERDHAQQRHEAERPAEQQQRARHPCDAERTSEEHQQGAAEAVQLEHEQREGDEQHDGHARRDGGGALGAFLHGAGDLDPVAGVSRGMPSAFQLAQAGQQRLGDGGALQAFDHVALHGDGVLAVLPPHDAGLPGEHGARDLGQGNGLARRCGKVGVRDVGDGLALVRRLPEHDVDQPVALAVLADGGAGEHGACGLGDGLAGDAERARLVLVDLQAHGFHGFVPVVVHAKHLRMFAQDLAYFVRMLAQPHRIVADHAELHRIGHGWAVGQQLHAGAHFGEFLGQHRRQGVPQCFTLRQVLGLQDDLRHVGLREDLVQRQVEPRHARADPGADRVHARLLDEALFHALEHGLVRGERGAFGEPCVDQDFRAAGIGEELLLNAPHAHDAQREEQQRDADGDPAVLHACIHGAAEGVVERAVEDLVRPLRNSRGGSGRMVFRLRVFGHLEQQRAQVRHEVHRDEPRQHERDDGDREDREGVFAGDRLGDADGQEARRGDQGTGEHRHGRDLVGESGSADFVVAFFHLPHHHLDGDDGIVHQQPERDDE